MAVTSRVPRGAKTSPAVSPVAIHTLVQNGQVTSSPIVFWPPCPRTSSRSSAGPDVHGADRDGPVRAGWDVADGRVLAGTISCLASSWPYRAA